MNGLTNSLAVNVRNMLFLSTLCCASSVYALGDRSNLSPLDPQDAEQATSTSHPTLTPEAMGDVLLARRRYVEAVESYRQSPNLTAVLWNKMGIAQQHLFNEREARRDYEKALQLNPKDSQATNNLGTVLYSQKDYRGAVRLYKRALKLDPKSATIYCNLGTAYFAQEKYKKGAETYHKALELDPTAFEHDSSVAIEEGTPSHQRAELSYFLAKTFAEAGKNEQAMKYLRRAFAQGFNDRKKIFSDKEFASLRETPEFRQLLTDEHLD
jgi:tetratricopeptide (TPR) repeat protein